MLEDMRYGHALFRKVKKFEQPRTHTGGTRSLGPTLVE